MFYIKNRITNDSYSRSKYLKTNMFNFVPIKHKQMSFVSNGGKFKLYTVYFFQRLLKSRFSFERMILVQYNDIFSSSLFTFYYYKKKWRHVITAGFIYYY
jgi:hypothetical protein